ncbi:MAG: site-2 protease family protein [Candidatus Dormibacteria bacterium]
MNGSVPIARIAGIRIRAHWSVLLIAFVLTWGLAQGIIPATLPGTALGLRWVASAAAAILLIASLTAHELAHSIVARHRGIPIADITLWVFGGVSHIRGAWESPRTEMIVAISGPATTLVIGALCFGLAVAFDAMSAPALLVLLAQWLAVVNGTLLVFNLVPAFPLDGGRLLRGALWTWRRDRAWATRNAARAGRAFGFLLIALGFADFLLTGDFGGLWLLFIGWFLENAARAELRGDTARRLLAGVRVGEVMTQHPMSVPSWLTVQLLIEQYAMRNQYATFPTHGLDGKVDGLVTVNGMKRVPPTQRSFRRAADIMIPRAYVPVARPDELVTDLLARVDARSDGHALVFDGDQLVGMVSPSDIGRRLQFGPQPPPVPRPAPWAPPTA